MSGAIPACSQAKSRPVRPKPVAISSAISSTPDVVAEPSQLAQIVGRVEPHAAGPLHDGLEDHRRELVAMRVEELAQIGEIAGLTAFAEAPRGPLREELLRERSREEPVHPRHRVADRHRPERVAVIAPAQREHPPSLGASARLPVLERELERDLDRDRPGIREKDALEPARRHFGEALAETDGRLVGQARQT